MIGTVKRTNIYLTDRQMKALQKKAAKIGVSIAELVRRILDEHIDREEK
jgi:predicted DNA binding CopG/RHH family protein